MAQPSVKIKRNEDLPHLPLGVLLALFPFTGAFALSENYEPETRPHFIFLFARQGHSCDSTGDVSPSYRFCDAPTFFLDLFADSYDPRVLAFLLLGLHVWPRSIF